MLFQELFSQHSVFTDDGETDRPSKPSRSGCQREGGNFSKADSRKTWCDGRIENAGSDEMGWIDE